MANAQTNALKVAIAGLGTVGAGTVQVLGEQADLLRQRAGLPIEVTAVSARDRNRDRGIDLSSFTWFDDAAQMAATADADVVVELVGGSNGPAKAIAEAALNSGRHLVTANKALIAHHGTDLAALAEKNDVQFNYEAAVAGGIPIIKSLREGLTANRVHRVAGILNGTANYILTRMHEEGLDFGEVLSDAQELGYAEADPSFDIDGVDAAHKLAILASLAFGIPVDIDAVHVEGIRNINAVDMVFADELGYRIKLLGIAKRTENGIEQRVHPCLIPADAAMANVNEAFNAVEVECDFADTVIHVGPGAGAGPTASAVVADIVDIARGTRVPAFGVNAGALTEQPRVPMSDHVGRYYIRLDVMDKAGVFAGIANALRDHDVSMDSVLQRGHAPGEAVPLVITLHENREANMVAALDQITSLDSVLGEPVVIRIEMLPG
ncbi:MAG: homoserine dehydrogenase [Rhodospirillales bacterium]